MAVFAAAAAEQLELPFGRAWRTPSLPGHPDLNTLLLSGSEPDADLLAATGIRQVEVWDDRVPTGLEAAGWESHRLLLMAFAGEPPAWPDHVAETDYAEAEPLRREWIAAIPRLAHLVEADIAAGERIRSATPTRAFVIRAGGRAVSMGLLIGDGPVRMVEDVYTTPSRRGRGLAGAVVAAAVAAAAGAELVFLPTGADNDAQRLYRRIGFEPLGTVTRFSCPP